MFEHWHWICSSLCGLLLTLPVSAQITPDTTLGNENTTLTPINPNTYHINGGAIRDINLFHSFLEFNIQQNQSIYFSNPLGVENILTRVTGNNLSHINGRLGVSGEANLFLLNPNGIIFGENASLDIRGSFLATTADSIQLGDNSFFSATDIANSQLLAIQPGALFHNALTNHQARIENQGNLQVGGNFTLDSDILSLQGQLHAGGDLLLNARDTVKLRDNSTIPFIATAGGEMLIQGNNSVDIFILNHPDSGLYSQGNMTLRSANPVIGDAHYQTGGNFRVETLDGSLGRFYSPDDPVVYANGDFSINDYTGASLHVLAGGTINIPGSITITGPDTIGNSINPTNTPNLATVITSDNQTITIDGSAEPTLDLRAGLDWAQLGGFPGNTTVGTGEFDGVANSTPPATAYSPTATRADINVGAISLSDPGRVFLTNQYIPNTALNGNIAVTDIVNEGNNGVTLDSRESINVNGFIDVSGRFTFVGGVFGVEDSGDITLLAGNDINLNGGFCCGGLSASGQRGGSIILNSQGNITLDNSYIASNSDNSVGGSVGNDIEITAQNLTVNNSYLENGTWQLGDSGNININVRETVAINQSYVETYVDSWAIGNAGNVNFAAGSLTLDNSILASSTYGTGNGGNVNINVRNNAVLNFGDVVSEAIGNGNTGDVNFATGSLTLDNSILGSSNFGEGNGGNVNINVRNNAVLDYGFVSSSFFGGIGSAGDVNFTAENLTLKNRSILTSSTFGQGNAGNVDINVRDTAVFDDSLAESSVQAGAIGNGGEVKLTADSLTVSNGSVFASDTFGQGNAGNVDINVRDTTVFDDSLVVSVVAPGAIGNGGEVKLTADSLTASNGSVFASDTFGQGNAGNVDINVRDTAVFNNSFAGSAVQAGAIGNGGEVKLTAGSLTASNVSAFASDTFGQGNAGNVEINVRDTAVFNNSFAGSAVQAGAIGNGGQVNVNAGSLTVSNVSELSSSTYGTGNAGNVEINVRDTAVFNNSFAVSAVQAGAIGNGGEVKLTADSLTASNNSVLSSNTFGQGNAGNVDINVRDTAVFNNSFAGSAVQAGAIGNGGQVTVNAGRLQLSNNASLSASAEGVGFAGDIAVNTGFLSLNSSRILTETRSGDGGNIGLNVDGILVLRHGSLISTTAGSAGVGGNGGNINIRAEFVIGVPLENSDITANAFEGQGGNILITTNGIYGLRFRDRLTPLSDITASSEFGLNGTFTLNLLSFPAEQGINELPGALVDAEALVGQDVCAVENNQIAGGSSFVVTGKGGLPPNPVDLMTPGTGAVEWASRSENAVAIVPRTEPLTRSQFQQTQGWIVTPSGQIQLTSVAPNAEMGAQGYAYPTCENWEG